MAQAKTRKQLAQAQMRFILVANRLIILKQALRKQQITETAAALPPPILR
jgi:hypothetical protein